MIAGPVTAGAGAAPSPRPEQAARLWAAARSFEAMALGQLLQPLFATADVTGGPFGGGDAEAAWRPLLVDAIGKQMASRGGIGLAAPVFDALLRAQEQKR